MAIISNIAKNLLFIGEDKTLEFTFPVATDITGYGLQFTLVDKVESPTFTVTKTTVSGITIISATVCNVSIEDTDTTGQLEGRFQGSLWRTDVGERRPLWSGVVYLTKGSIN